MMKNLGEKSVLLCLREREITYFNHLGLMKKILVTISDHKNVFIDMSKVNYIDSAGFGMFVTIFMEAHLTDCSLHIINLKEHLTEVFYFLRLDRVISLKEHSELSDLR